jgi:hypothetical protein
MSMILKQIPKVFVSYICFDFELEQILSLQVEIGMKRNVSIRSRKNSNKKVCFYLLPGHNWNKRTFLFAPG